MGQNPATNVSAFPGKQRHRLNESGDDFYETPAVATEALLKCEFLPKRIWEPAAGRGAIAKVLRAHGHEVVASDLIDYGEPSQFPKWDFLMERKLPEGVQAIVTNPPYKLADFFVRHALELCPNVVMLLRLAFLESSGRDDILNKLARVHLFKNRLPMMHRSSYAGPKSTSKIAFAWFVWEQGHVGATTINRIKWEPMPDTTGAGG